LTVSNVSDDDQTASGLGIEGFVGTSLMGTDLQPRPSIEIAETTGTTAAGLGILGSYQADRAGEDLDPQLTVDDNLADLRNRIGLDGSQFTIWQGERSLIVDFDDPGMATVQDFLDRINNSPLEINASINASGRGIQIRNDDRYRSLVIKDDNGGSAARQMNLFGSSDIMGSLLVLIDALRNDDREAIGMLIQNMDDGITQSLEVRAGVGTQSMLLETSQNRLTSLELSYTDLLANVEDADLTRVITDLASMENSYQAALAAAGRIIQPSLLNFLQ
jgi:flagellin-like hook-associated protein FlgL